MKLLQPLIAHVRAAVGALIQAQRLLGRQCSVMARAGHQGTRQHHLAVRFDQQQSLEAVALFLAARVAVLFFLGRSIGVSVASSNTSSKPSPSCSARWRLGRLKRPESSKRRSTLLTIRWAVDSYPQSTPQHETMCDTHASTAASAAVDRPPTAHWVVPAYVWSARLLPAPLPSRQTAYI